MKNIIFFLFFFFFFLFNKSVNAETNISFIDVDYIYSNSIVGKKNDDDLKSKSKKINDELSNYKNKIKDEKNKLTNQKKIISDEDFKNKAIDLEKKAAKYNKIISDKNKDFINYKNKTKQIFLKKLMDIVKKYAEDNSIQLVLKKENIIIGKNDLDISNNILDLLNKKIKSIN